MAESEESALPVSLVLLSVIKTLFRSALLSTTTAGELAKDLDDAETTEIIEGVELSVEANDVRVMITNANPKLGIEAVHLHRKHDNEPPYEQHWQLAYGEPLELDFIAMDKDRTLTLIYRSDIGGQQIAHPLPMGQGLSERKQGITFEVRAWAKPPVQIADAYYHAFIDTDGDFKVEQVYSLNLDTGESQT